MLADPDPEDPGDEPYETYIRKTKYWYKLVPGTFFSGFFCYTFLSAYAAFRTASVCIRDT